jgi:hypothetical protein
MPDAWRIFNRFRFTIRDNVKFNHRLIVDVIYIKKKPVLHAVDEATAFQAARFLQNLQARTTWDTLRFMWIDTYLGPPDVIVTDAGTNFVGSEFVNNARILAIEVEEICQMIWVLSGSFGVTILYKTEE